MAETPSKMLPLGTIAPTFELADVKSGKKLSLNDLKSNIGTVIMFLCNHCPYVKHIQRQLVEMADLYQAKGLRFIAISSNDAKRYPADGPEKMREEANQHRYPFPYLYDETQAVARAYQAACTPDFYLFDKDMKCVYRGRFDGATPGNHVAVTGADLREALECVLNNKPVSQQQIPSLGCNIKWKV